MRKREHRKMVRLLFGLCLLLTACGGGSSTGDGGEAGSTGDGGSNACEPLPEPPTNNVALSASGTDRGFAGPFACASAGSPEELDCAIGMEGMLGWVRLRLIFPAPFNAPAEGVVLRQGSDFRVGGVSYAPMNGRTLHNGGPWSGDLTLRGGSPARLSGQLCSISGWRLALNNVAAMLP